MISDLGESLRRIFAATAHVGTRFSCYFHILFTLRKRQNSHVELFASGKIFRENQRRKKVLGQEKKKSPLKKERKEERVPFCPEKKKNSFLKATGRS